MTRKDRAPRIAVFTHDTFGLGHVRRCSHIVNALAEREPDAAILFVTGSPALHTLGFLSRNVDYVKIPTIVKTGTEESQPPHLAIPIHEVSEMRERIIKETVLSFDPGVLLVDNFPLGSRKELLPTLEALRETETRTILGLRDIVDAPDVIQADWAKRDIYGVLESYYDRILVYGMRKVLDAAEAYGVPDSVAERIRYCGYVTAGELQLRPAEEIRRELGIDRPFVLATVGGGGDGYPLLDTFARALPQLGDVPAVLITGPLMSPADREALRLITQANGSDVRILDFVNDLPSFMNAAEVVVAMGGYNTTAEILAVRPKAIIVPRTWRYGEHKNRAETTEEWEQTLRARALSQMGLVDVIEAGDLSPEGLASKVTSAMKRPRPVAQESMDMLGLPRAAESILEMLPQREGVASVHG